MRVHCVGEIVDNVRATLQKTGIDVKTRTLCLNVFGAYISWIDLSLIANDQVSFMHVLYSKQMCADNAVDNVGYCKWR